MTNVALFAFAFLTSLFLIPVLRRVAVKYGLFDEFEGDELKIHTRKTSYLGGAALAVGAILSLAVFGGREVWPVIVASLLLFALGFWDDVKWKHISSARPFQKLLLLLVIPGAASLVLASSVFPVWMVGVIFFYVFVSVNALNYQDGMDGLAGGLSLISFAGFALVSLLTNNPLVLLLSLALSGSTLAFLVFNVPPAKIFMGDSGAYFLGFFLALLALLSSDFGGIVGVLGPVFLVGVPLFEGGFTNIRRIVQGKSIVRGDRSHAYDVLLRQGYSAKTVLSLFYTLQILFVLLGIWLLL